MMQISCDRTLYPLPAKPAMLTITQQRHYQAEIKQLLKQHNAVMIAHYYTDPQLQALAEETGGCVADSLEMARFGHQHPADILVIAGVRFMGETAKILSPHKRVLMPTLAAECSLDLSCPAENFRGFCAQHPDRTIVVYANTSAAIKAQADWVVTSSIALELIDTLDSRGEKILWAPDRHMGEYLQRQTGADVLSWSGVCIVHDEFKARSLRQLKELYPEAATLVHPEAPAAVIAQADVVGSTAQLIRAAQQLPQQTLIVATDRGIFYKMQLACPEKQLLSAPTAGEGASCRSCSQCPWMALNSLPAVVEALSSDRQAHEIQIDPVVSARALLPLNRMLDFAQQLKN